MVGHDGRRWLRRLDRAADAALAGLCAALVGIVLVAVFFRYALNRSLSWSDELVRYLFVWFTLLGAAVAVREREHIRVDYFADRLPPAWRRAAAAVSLSGVCLFHAALVALGAGWVYATRGSFTSALQWPLNLFFYAALPATAALGLWYALRRLASGAYAERESAPDEAPPAHGEEAAPWPS